MNTIEKDFCKTLFSLYEDQAQSLVVAFSGGCDSLALLVLAVKALGKEKVFPVYVNHNLRSSEELQREIALNEANCRKIGVKLEVCTIVEGEIAALAKARSGGLEDAARLLRYQLLEEKRRFHNCAYVATAHHRQDQVETIAMRLSQGSPVSSLSGIVQKDEVRHLIRPLLAFERKELEAYLSAQNYCWSTDSTNEDISYTRNKLRRQVLPQAKALWPEGEQTLLALSRVAKSLSEGLPKVEDCIFVESFKPLNPTQKTLTLFTLWNAVFSQVEMPMALVRRVCEAIAANKNQKICANGACILIKEGILTIKALEETSQEDNLVEIEFDPYIDQQIPLVLGSAPLSLLSGRYAEPYATEKSLRLNSATFKGKPRLRYAKMGDWIRLKGGKKMVLRLLQDMKIPQNLRNKVPVLVDDEGLCAVFGSVFGGFDRICVKFCSSLAPNDFTLYIVHKG